MLNFYYIKIFFYQQLQFRNSKVAPSMLDVVSGMHYQQAITYFNSMRRRVVVTCIFFQGSQNALLQDPYNWRSIPRS